MYVPMSYLNTSLYIDIVLNVTSNHIIGSSIPPYLF